MLKLGEESRARQIVEHRVTLSVLREARADQLRWHLRGAMRFYLMAVGFLTAGSAIVVAIGSAEHKSIIEYLRSVAPGFAVTFNFFASVSLIICTFFLLRGRRRIKENRDAYRKEAKALEKSLFSSDIAAEVASTDADEESKN